MLYFAAKKEEVGAVKLFRKNCTYHGLDVHLSLNAMLALKLVVESNLQNVTAGINDRDTHTCLLYTSHDRRKETGHIHGHMLQIMAKERGYNTYAALRAASVRENE